MQTTSIQPQPVLRALLLLSSGVFGLISLLALAIIITRELESYFGISVFLLLMATLTVAAARKAAALDPRRAERQAQARSATTGQPLVGVYDVVYKGGLPEYPTSKAGKICMEILPDCFNFVPTLGTKGWFAGQAIPFNAITDLTIVQRQVNTVEGLLGGLDSRQLNQANNIHITFYNADGLQLILRLEMLTGLTVMGQAAKCREFEDRLRTAGIRDHFYSPPAATARPAQVLPPAAVAPDIPEQIEKLALLRDKGLISATEYDAKKADLLTRM